MQFITREALLEYMGSALDNMGYGSKIPLHFGEISVTFVAREGNIHTILTERRSEIVRGPKKSESVMR